MTNRRRRKRTSKQVNIIKMPTHLLEMEPTREMEKKSQRPLEENWVKILWEEVRRANKSKDNKGKAPIAKVDVDKKQPWLDLVIKYVEN